MAKLRQSGEMFSECLANQREYTLQARARESNADRSQQLANQKLPLQDVPGSLASKGHSDWLTIHSIHMSDIDAKEFSIERSQ